MNVTTIDVRDRLLSAIENEASKAARAMYQYCQCDPNDTIGLRNIAASKEYYEERLKKAKEDFLEEFPGQEEKVEKFIADIKCYEGLIAEKEADVDRFQTRKYELFKDFLNN